MKVWITFLVLVLVVQRSDSSSPFKLQIKDFYIWMTQFNVQYASAAKQYVALLNFIRVWSVIDEHNRKYDLGLTEFQMAMNQFAGSSPQELAQINNGTMIPAIDFSNFTVRPKAIVAVTPDMFPPGNSSVDWNAEGHVTSVKDQGFVCNSCWAFSTAAALETAISIKFKRLVNVSTQYLIDCNRNYETGNFGCSGGSVASAYMNIQYSPGIPSWETYPYLEDVRHQGTYSCRYQSSTSVGQTTGYGRIPAGDEETLARVVATTAVVCAMNSELDTFSFYKVGIYNDAQCKPGTAHSIVIVGYSSIKLRNGTIVDYWNCKNSWSTTWGNQGFFKIIRGRNMCGISAYCIYPLLT